ncbi:MAG: hypothetical protein ACLU3F_00275 [Blautia wexlerae]
MRRIICSWECSRYQIPKKKKGRECIDIRFTYDINGILEVEVTVVSNGKKVSKILSQNMDEKEIEKRMQQLQKLKIHPKDMTENRLMKERLQVLFEESLPETRERILSYIEYFDQILASQDPRRIRTLSGITGTGHCFPGNI